MPSVLYARLIAPNARWHHAPSEYQMQPLTLGFFYTRQLAGKPVILVCPGDF